MPNGKLTPIIFAEPAVDFLLSAHEKYYVDGADLEPREFIPAPAGPSS